MTDEQIHSNTKVIDALKEIFLLMNTAFVTSNNLVELDDDILAERIQKATDALWGLKSVGEDLLKEKQKRYRNLVFYDLCPTYPGYLKELHESDDLLKYAADRLVKIQRLCAHIDKLHQTYRIFIDNKEALDARLKTSKLEKAEKVCKYIPFLSKFFK